MSEVGKVAIEFPCEYPVKIIGTAAADFREAMEAIVERHAPAFPRDRTTVRMSSGGRYAAVTVYIVATGEQQLRALFEELKASGRVQMVL